MARWNIMIHYFITWFKYNDHYKNCIKHVHMDGTRISKAKCVVRIIVLQPCGNILGTCYLIIMKCEKI
jgi:hypothetical protein